MFAYDRNSSGGLTRREADALLGAALVSMPVEERDALLQEADEDQHSEVHAGNSESSLFASTGAFEGWAR